ncbi:hypothetical protein OG21DRAFT_1502042 [Imleria badia]|nr:hypothetical protein OG21DRAFT_1502047 [Imleria badia]KAF8546192.1 hypothetical protein OG21DRAFT_1502042 [Imleria badia]
MNITPTTGRAPTWYANLALDPTLTGPVTQRAREDGMGRLSKYRAFPPASIRIAATVALKRARSLLIKPRYRSTRESEHSATLTTPSASSAYTPLLGSPGSATGNIGATYAHSWSVLTPVQSLAALEVVHVAVGLPIPTTLMQVSSRILVWAIVVRFPSTHASPIYTTMFKNIINLVELWKASELLVGVDLAEGHEKGQ